MSRIADRFAALKARGEKGLVTFVTAGDPDLAGTEQVVLELEKAGADLIELGVPFSDPMADGPTIQKASERALASGTTLAAILATVKSVRQQTQVPIILMGYYNPIFLYGPDRFAADAAAAGVDGVLIVDLPPEEAGEFRKVSAAAGLDVIFSSPPPPMLAGSPRWHATAAALSTTFPSPASPGHGRALPTRSSATWRRSSG